jgi:uncharacterized protein YbbC (DUF1343 family)
MIRGLLCLCLLTALPPAPAATPRTPKVYAGIDVLETGGFAPIRGKRVGLISNPAGVNRLGIPTWRVLRSAPGVQLVALFGAEHGFDGRARAGIEIPDATHPSTGLPVYSLYGPGPTRKPTARMLEGIDVLIYDIQDTGCRSYTFISTLGLAMEACAKAGVSFLVLDRPNPLGGIRVEGPNLDPRFKSFVGQWPIPYVYGLTPGELARMIHGEGWIQPKAKLSVIPLRGWHRGMTWTETGLKWTATSPNVPSGESPMYLVATGILGEIGGLDLGTGSPVSFQIIAAPWLDGRSFSRRMNRAGLKGIRFEPYAADANRNPADGAEVRGVRLRITQPATAPLFAVGFHALAAVKDVSGRDLFQRAVQRGRGWEMFDKVTGSDRTRKALQAGTPVQSIVRSWEPVAQSFRDQRKPYLIYPEKTPGPPATPSRASARASR